MKTILTATAFAAALVSACASADDKPRKGEAASGRSASAALFERLDRNKDGFVTRDEAKEATELQGRFVELDRNNDGKISAEEMRGLDGGRGAAGATKAKR